MTDQNKIKVLTRTADGFTATIQNKPTVAAPWRETTCRVCGAPKTAHDADCPEANDVLLQQEVATLGEPPFDHVHDPVACHHCQDMRQQLLTDLRTFLHGVRGDLLDSNPRDDRSQEIRQIDSLIWRTTEALGAVQ